MSATTAMTAPAVETVVALVTTGHAGELWVHITQTYADGVATSWAHRFANDTPATDHGLGTPASANEPREAIA